VKILHVVTLFVDNFFSSDLPIPGLTKFTQEPRDLNAYEGEKARFACSVSVDTGTGASEGPSDYARPDYWAAARTGEGMILSMETFYKLWPWKTWRRYCRTSSSTK